jgi:hypothetical protein
MIPDIVEYILEIMRKKASLLTKKEFASTRASAVQKRFILMGTLSYEGAKRQDPKQPGVNFKKESFTRGPQCRRQSLSSLPRSRYIISQWKLRIWANDSPHDFDSPPPT